MVGFQITRQLIRMRRDWNRRAKENARHYVVTGQHQWSDEEFFQSGQVMLEEHVFTDLPTGCQGRDPNDMRVLGIGCGAGRVPRAMAEFFGEVYAVDISREMVRQARQAVAGFPNAHVIRNNGKDLSAVAPHWWGRFGIGRQLEFDFAFSVIVFQHIPSREIIESYVREVHRMLRPGGLFKFQVQGSPVEADPEHSWVGAWFTVQQARGMADHCGFQLPYERRSVDQY